MLNSVKCFSKFQADDTSCSSLTHQQCNPVIGHQIYQAPFACNEAVLAVTNHHLIIFHLPQNSAEDLLHDLARNLCETDWHVAPQVLLPSLLKNGAYVSPLTSHEDFTRLP